MSAKNMTLGFMFLPPSDTHPEDPVEGSAYLNTSDDFIHIYSEGEWYIMAGSIVMGDLPIGQQEFDFVKEELPWVKKINS